MLAHLVIRHGRFTWSGYGASGDPSHTHALVIDVGRGFLITSEGQLYLIGPRHQFEEFTPGGLVLAARRGMFGFRVVQDTEAASRHRDREQRRRQRLGRRGRIGEDQR